MSSRDLLVHDEVGGSWADPADSEPELVVPHAPAPKSGGIRWQIHVRLLLFFSALAVAQFREAWVNPRERWIGVDGDATAQMWFLSWTPRALLDGQNPFFTDHLNYPDGVNLMWNTLMPLLGVVVAPVTWMSGPVLSYNLLITGGVALSAWTASTLAYRYSGSWPASTVAGLIFGFSPYMMAHAWGHLNLTFLVLVPVGFLLIDDLLVRQRRASWVTGAGLGAVLAAQFLISQEVLATMALCAVVALLVLAVMRPAEARRRAPYVVRGLCATGVVALVLCAWPLWMMLRGPGRIGSGKIHSDPYYTDLAEFVRPTSLQQFASSWAGNGAHVWGRYVHEWNGYLGIPLLVLVGYIVWCYRSRFVVKALAIVAAAVALLSLGPDLRLDGRLTGIPLPFRLMEQLPVVEQVLPQRLMAYVFLCVGLLVAVFLGRQPASASRRRVGLTYAIVLVALLPLVPSQPQATSAVAVPEFFEHDGRVTQLGDDAVVVNLPNATPGDAHSMLRQAVADMRFRTPFGYFVGADGDGRPTVGPTTYSTAGAVLSADTYGRVRLPEEAYARSPAVVEAIRADFRRWGVDAVVVGPMYERPAVIALLTDVLGRPPEETQGVAVWWEESV